MNRQSTERVWFALRVKPQKEIVAERILRGLNYMAVTPTRSEWRHASRKAVNQKRKRKVYFPVMWGYVLVAFPSDQRFINWYDLTRLHIVSSIVAVNGLPLQLSGDQVDAAMKDWGVRLQARDISKYMRSHGEYEVGDTVHVFAGGFDGVEGKVVDITNGEARVLMKFMNAEHVVTAPLDGCAKAA